MAASEVAGCVYIADRATDVVRKVDIIFPYPDLTQSHLGLDHIKFTQDRPPAQSCRNTQGVPIFSDASLAQTPANFGPKRCFLVS